MHFLLVNRFFGGEQTPTGRMLHDVAVELVKRGHRVTVLTSVGVYSDAETIENNKIESVSVIRLTTLGSGKLSQMLTFWLGVAIRIPFIGWDRCVLLTDPPFLPLAALFSKLLRRRRKIFWWTMDLYPEAMVAARMIRNRGAVDWSLRFINELGLRILSGVICLGPTQRARMQQYSNWRTDEAFSVLVPPWDLRPIEVIDRAHNPLIRRFGWDGKRLAIYAGNLGKGHLYKEYVDAARSLSDQGREDWLFVFACRGTGVNGLREASQDLRNVFVTDYLPTNETGALLSAASVHLISMKNDWQGSIVPSKLYGTMQTEAPVLFIGPLDADTALEINAHSRGICLPSETESEKIIQALDELCKMNLLSPAKQALDGPGRVSDFVSL